ncbi:hypothetical protein GIB67_017638 [Kingdonia uniflora]|uniref:TF-B3 domain-containing protein n=1 Tax=Kingdonia uniflora TaxID=39325 RepID=A0A7J7LNC3_9MAGN|nr:hypothetical protein GIB67_017638 [Kingdonia uniflora]
MVKELKKEEKLSYEEFRQQRLEENRKRMESLNLPKLAQSLRTPPKPSLMIAIDVERTRRVTYGKGRCSKHRDLSNRVYASPQARASAIEKAEALESTLEEEFPTFIKPMLQSHTTGGFWLGLPVDFCKKYLPRKDETITLIDEDMDESPTNYLALKRGLSAGWRGFAIAHNLVDGDALIFQLVETRKFKVYIIRVNE